MQVAFDFQPLTKIEVTLIYMNQDTPRTVDVVLFGMSDFSHQLERELNEANENIHVLRRNLEAEIDKLRAELIEANRCNKNQQDALKEFVKAVDPTEKMFLREAIEEAAKLRAAHEELLKGNDAPSTCPQV